MLIRSRIVLSAAFSITALLGACASDSGTSDDTLPQGTGANGLGASSGSGGSGATGGVNGRAGGKAIGTGGTIPVVIGESGAAGALPGPGNGEPEVCDGKDNDENGIVDDVDEGGDGVCDCLNIGTIGHIGPWSDGGNIFEDWLNARTPQGAVALEDRELTPERLAPLQVIVVLHVAELEAVNTANNESAPAHHPFSDDEAEAFAEWVEDGGGVMTTIGYSLDEAAEIVNVNRLLAPLGTGYSTTRFFYLNDFISNWEQHPVTDGVSNIFTLNGIEPDSGGMVLARGNGDSTALRVLEVDKGRAVIWGDEWITYDSEWEDLEDQQVELFWLNILKWLSPPKTCQVPIPDEVR
jgi:hypothetical protein